MVDELKKLKRQNRKLKSELKELKSPTTNENINPTADNTNSEMVKLLEAALRAVALKPNPTLPEPTPAKPIPDKKTHKSLMTILFGPTVHKKSPSSTSSSTIPQVKKVGGRHTWAIWAGTGIFALAIIIFILYIQAPTNQIMAILFVIIGAVGAGLLWYGFQKKEEGVYFKEPLRPGEKPLKGQANCLNIYYRKDTAGNKKTYKIAFEILTNEELEKMQAEHLLGKYQRCRNDGNFYFVHEQNPDDGLLYPFNLPDQVYFNPHELINVVTMPASHKYAKPKSGNMDKLKPAFLLIGIGIMAILLIVNSGSTPPENNNPQTAIMR